MAKKFTNVTDLAGNQVPTMEFDVYAGSAVSIKAGNPVIVDGSHAGYVTNAANGATSFKGIAASDSTDTATADGTVLVYMAPVLKFNAVATTPANLAQALKGTKVTIDVSSADYTADENDTSSGFMSIIDYDNTTDGNVTLMAACTL